MNQRQQHCCLNLIFQKPLKITMTVFTIDTIDGKYTITGRYDGEVVDIVRTVDQETGVRTVLGPGDLDKYEPELHDAAEKRQLDEARDREVRG